MQGRSKIVLAAILIPVMIALCAQPAEKEKTPIKIGVMVDLSGPLTSYGKSIKNALEIAKGDINAYLEKKGLPYTVEFYVEDTKVDPKVSLEKIQDLHSKGINLVIGPMGSGEVKNIMGYVQSNRIVIISPSSTALPSLLGLTKPENKKYVFRFVGTDDLQTDAITAEIKDLGIKAVVIAYIGNAWGKGLYDTIKPKLEAAGVEIKGYVEYPEPPPADFSPFIAELEGYVNDLLQNYNASEIAVVIFSYEEVATMLAQTKGNSPLLNVLWFGCDGTALSDKVIEVCEKSSKVRLLSTLFESKGGAYDKLAEKYREKGFGDSPYQYALNAYDAAWVLTLSYIEVVKEKGRYDADAMNAKIPEVTEKYSKGEYGIMPVSGYISLNEWNDRASGDYAIYEVKTSCKWKTAGLWKFVEQKIEWYG